MAERISVPLGPSPGWELDDQDSVEDPSPSLQSVAASHVVLQSLKQSRERWLTSAFTKFSTRVRAGKKPDVVPPPHQLRPLGRCDVEVGPHTFHDTGFFEVHYTHAPNPSSFYPTPAPFQQPFTSYTSGTTQYSSSTPSTSFQAASSSSPFMSSVSSGVSVTPDLLSQVNHAASSDPALAKLLQRAATGQATTEELKRLGVLIQSMATAPPPSSYGSSWAAPGVPPSPAAVDLVIEFRERASDRWIIPRALAVCEKRRLSQFSDELFEVIITTVIAARSPSATQDSNQTRSQIVTLCLTKAPSNIWEAVERWAGGEKNQHNIHALEILEQQTAERVYLQHQLPEGPVLAKLQSLSVPPYSTRPLNSSDQPKTKRKSQARVAHGDAAEKPAKATDAAGTNSKTKGKGKERDDKAGRAREAKEAAPKAPLQKKPRTAPARPPVQAPVHAFACQKCGMTDVPLMLNGQFCRECIDAGGIPMGQPRRSPS